MIIQKLRTVWGTFFNALWEGAGDEEEDAPTLLAP
jgi:hypothetical protein